MTEVASQASNVPETQAQAGEQNGANWAMLEKQTMAQDEKRSDESEKPEKSSKEILEEKEDEESADGRAKVTRLLACRRREVVDENGEKRQVIMTGKEALQADLAEADAKIEEIREKIGGNGTVTMECDQEDAERRWRRSPALWVWREGSRVSAGYELLAPIETAEEKAAKLAKAKEEFKEYKVEYARTHMDEAPTTQEEARALNQRMKETFVKKKTEEERSKWKVAVTIWNNQEMAVAVGKRNAIQEKMAFIEEFRAKHPERVAKLEKSAEDTKVAVEVRELVTTRRGEAGDDMEKMQMIARYRKEHPGELEALEQKYDDDHDIYPEIDEDFTVEDKEKMARERAERIAARKQEEHDETVAQYDAKIAKEKKLLEKDEETLRLRKEMDGKNKMMMKFNTQRVISDKNVIQQLEAERDAFAKTGSPEQARKARIQMSQSQAELGLSEAQRALKSARVWEFSKKKQLRAQIEQFSRDIKSSQDAISKIEG